MDVLNNRQENVRDQTLRDQANTLDLDGPLMVQLLHRFQ